MGGRSRSTERGLTVVVAGGGVAALEAALALQALAGRRVDVELVSPEPRFYYRPLSVAEPFGAGELRHYELGRLAALAGASLTLGAVAAVDAERREARTAGGAVLPFDALLVACGTLPKPCVDGAVTFRGPADMEHIAALIAEAGSGSVDSIAYSIPAGAVWSLPAYELALLTAASLESRGRCSVEIVVTTPEKAPLALFGPRASGATATLLRRHGIVIRTECRAVSFGGGGLRLASGEVITADRAVALPRLEGPGIDGLPRTRHGFIPIDRHCRVEGLAEIFAAGDITTFPIKQGGIAAQQADAAAQMIAAAAGADLVPEPFRPVLRGMLLTGSAPRFMRHDLAHPDRDALAGPDALWWPPAKIAGHYLGPFVCSLDRSSGAAKRLVPPAGIPVLVELGDAAWQGAGPTGADPDGLDDAGPTADRNLR
jgi:sulfide:quinone oxidoreductase